MAGEIIGELLGLGIETTVSDNGKVSKGGCLFLLLILFGIGGFIYYESNKEPNIIKGIVMEKLPDNVVLVKSNKGLNTYSIPSELYLNKKKTDSIIINQ